MKDLRVYFSNCMILLERMKENKAQKWLDKNFNDDLSDSEKNKLLFEFWLYLRYGIDEYAYADIISDAIWYGHEMVKKTSNDDLYSFYFFIRRTLSIISYKLNVFLDNITNLLLH